MIRELIVNTEDTLSGAPRISNRRISVKHVVTGILEYDNGIIKSYLEDFEISLLQAKHAIMYCKDEICEFKNVSRACTGCSKKFKNDSQEYIDEEGSFTEIFKKDYSNIDEKTIFLGNLDDFKIESEGEDIWKIAQKIYLEIREELSLPFSYEQIIKE